MAVTNYQRMKQCFDLSANWDELCADSDWRVRYTAAVAIGESQNPELVMYLEKMMLNEETRSLYNQPKCDFIGSEDGTRMAEEIGPITAVFDRPYIEEVKEAWKCRGRVKFACAKAVARLKTATPQIRALLRQYLTQEQEAYNVKAAAANALAFVGLPEDIPSLEISVKFDEWCTQMESKKALTAIRERLR